MTHQESILSELDQVLVRLMARPFGWTKLAYEHESYAKDVENIKKIIDLGIEKSVGFSITFSNDYKKFLKSEI